MKYSQILINKLLSTNIHGEIYFKKLKNKKKLLFSIKNNNISIENNKLLLTEIKTNKICINCSRNGIYTDNMNNYCWIHCQM